MGQRLPSQPFSATARCLLLLQQRPSLCIAAKCSDVPVAGISTGYPRNEGSSRHDIQAKTVMTCRSPRCVNRS
jgi:hypothetical protein